MALRGLRSLYFALAGAVERFRYHFPWHASGADRDQVAVEGYSR
jgi:hypothetical protein